MREIAVSECLQAQPLLPDFPVTNKTYYSILLLLDGSMNVMVAVSWHTFPAQSCHIGNAPGRSGDILKARPRQPALTGPGASPRAAPELPGWLPASRARLGNTTTMIPLVTAGRQTVTNMLPVLVPCDSDSVVR